MANTVVFSSCSSAVRQRFTASSSSSKTSSSPCRGNCNRHRNVALGSLAHFTLQGLEVSTCISRIQPTRFGPRASAEAGPEVEIVRDEEWERLMRKQSAEREQQREADREVERSKEALYNSMTNELEKFPKEKIKEARKFVASLIIAGEKVEEMIVEAADNGDLTPLVLLVVRNRLDLARQDDERDAIQAFDLLFRRLETEMLSRQASPAMQLLNELLHLHDGISREEWLRRSRLIMLQIFPPEDAFSILGGLDFDLSNQHGPIEMPEEEDEILLRIDFIREVDDFLSSLLAEPKIEPLQGFDAPSIAIRLRQEERIRAIEQVRDLRNLAIKLQRCWWLTRTIRKSLEVEMSQKGGATNALNACNRGHIMCDRTSEQKRYGAPSIRDVLLPAIEPISCVPRMLSEVHTYIPEKEIVALFLENCYSLQTPVKYSSLSCYGQLMTIMDRN